MHMKLLKSQWSWEIGESGNTRSIRREISCAVANLWVILKRRNHFFLDTYRKNGSSHSRFSDLRNT